jgi:hypothetical protein
VIYLIIYANRTTIIILDSTISTEEDSDGGNEVVFGKASSTDLS